MKTSLWTSLCYMVLLAFTMPVLGGQQVMMKPVVIGGQSAGNTVLAANVCNPCAKNPCAKKKMANPCGKEKSAGHKMMKNPCNPCGKKMNPCGHKMMNPCNPCGMKMNPCAHHEMANPCKGKR